MEKLNLSSGIVLLYIYVMFNKFENFKVNISNLLKFDCVWYILLYYLDLTFKQNTIQKKKI